MDSDSDPIEIRLITEEDIGEPLLKFVDEFFIKDEPLEKCIQRDHSPSFYQYLGNVIKQGTSMMAVDTSRNNLIVGIRLNQIERRGHPRDVNPVTPAATPKTERERRSFEATRKLNDLLDFGKSQFDTWKDPAINSTLEFVIGAVHKDYRGQNVYSRMIEATFEMMRREKVQMVFTLVTGKYSRGVMERFGLNVQFEMKYADYKVNGEQVFHPDKIHEGFAVMSKTVLGYCG